VSVTNSVYIFHGRDSSPEGRKIQAMAAIARTCGWKTIIPDYSAIKDPDERVRLFFETYDAPTVGKKILAGSSMGGYVAIEASRIVKPDALFLLAPAIYIQGYAQINPEPVAGHTTIIHGWNDQLIAPTCAVRFADRFKADLHLLNDQHELYQSIPFIERVFHDLLQSHSSATRLASLVPAL